MISVVLFGRNDNHGRNLPHRACLSINAIAEQLTHPTDEILFCDWNSPDDAPSFPEAHQAWLSEAAQDRLRIVRVSSAIHEQHYARDCTMPVVPVVAYNVGIAHSNPKNRWVLITTTDMVIVPRTNGSGASLSDVAEGLRDGYWGLPRFEMPEVLWSCLVPWDGAETIEAFRRWGPDMHLEEIVRQAPPDYFDAPGDFQLVLRDDLFEIGGIDEDMCLGPIGVDSNLAKRIQLLGRSMGGLEQYFAGYHCDHTRYPSASHSRYRIENDTRFFVEEVTEAPLPRQIDRFGLMRQGLVPFKLDAIDADQRTRQRAPMIEQTDRERRRGISDALTAQLAPALEAPLEASREHRVFNTLTIPVRHTLPFVIDRLDLVCAGHAGVVAYFGENQDLYAVLQAICGVLYPQVRLVNGGVNGTQSVGEIDALAYVFDFSLPSPQGDEAGSGGGDWRRLSLSLRRALVALSRAKQETDCYCIAINTIHTDNETFILNCIRSPLTPYTTRVRSGYLIDRVVDPALMADPVFVLETGWSAQEPRAQAMAKSLSRPEGMSASEYSRAWALSQELRRLPIDRLHQCRGTWAEPAVWAFMKAEAQAILDAQGDRDDAAAWSDRADAVADAIRHRRTPWIHTLLRRKTVEMIPIAQSHANRAMPTTPMEDTKTHVWLESSFNWDDADFRKWAIRLRENDQAMNGFHRDRYLWPYAAFLRLLEIHDLLRPDRHLLVNLGTGEFLGFYLSLLGPKVTFCRMFVDGISPIEDNAWKTWRDSGGRLSPKLYDPDRVAFQPDLLIDPTLPSGQPPVSVDAILMPTQLTNTIDVVSAVERLSGHQNPSASGKQVLLLGSIDVDACRPVQRNRPTTDERTWHLRLAGLPRSGLFIKRERVVVSGDTDSLPVYGSSERADRQGQMAHRPFSRAEPTDSGDRGVRRHCVMMSLYTLGAPRDRHKTSFVLVRRTVGTLLGWARYIVKNSRLRHWILRKSGIV